MVRILAAMALTMLMLPAPAAADWLQAGNGPDRAGHATGGGPDWGSVAYDVTFPSSAPLTALHAGPLVIAGQIYFAFAEFLNRDPVTNSYSSPITHVWRVSGSTGDAHLLADLDHAVAGMASDGSVLYVAGGGIVDAIPLDGTAGWNAPISTYSTAQAVPKMAGATSPLPDSQTCVAPLLEGGMLWLGCVDFEDFGTTWKLHAFNLTSRKDDWTWRSTTDGQPVPQPPGSVNDVQRQLNGNGPAGLLGTPRVMGLALVSGMLLLSVAIDQTQAQEVPVTPQTSTVYAITKQGTTLWQAHDLVPDTNAPTHTQNLVAPVVGGDGAAYLKLNALSKRAHPATAEDGQSYAVRDLAVTEGDLGSGMAYSNGSLYVATAHKVVRLTSNFEPRWTYMLPDAGAKWEQGGLIVDDLCLYGQARISGLASSLFCIDPVHGTLRWRYDYASDGSTGFSVDHGIVALGLGKGRLVLLGRTPFAMGLVAKTSTLYPAEGTVAVDVEVTDDGLGGDVQYAADWGDGVGAWSRDPHLEHVVPLKQDVAARFFARNSANQTASVPMTFHVGQVDPGLSWFDRQFLPQNQNQTFFVIGLLATFFGALLGVVLRGRKRRRMHREMQALEATFRQARDEPERCERELMEAKARYRDLLRRHRLEEDHYAILTDRADELLGRTRIGTLEETFGFLPFNVVQMIQVALRDGRFTRKERAVVLDAVTAAKDLTAEQRGRVARQVEDWFAADSGAS